MDNLQEATPPGAKKHSRESNIIIWSKIVASAVTVLSVALLIYRFWDVPILADVKLGAVLRASGWNGREAADIIVSRANQMVENSKYGFDIGRYRQRVSGMQYLEQIRIPKTSFSLREVIWALDRILLRRSIIVDASAAKDREKYTLSMTSEGETETFTTSEKEKLLCQGANYLLLLTEPYVLAAALFNLEKARGLTDFEKTTQVIDRMIKHNHPDLIYAYTLKGNILSFRGEYASAHAACNRAIAIDPKSWVGHACAADTFATESLHVGSAATPQGIELCRMADAEFAKAESLGHPMMKAYHLWSVCKDAVGDKQSAARMREHYSDDRDFVPEDCPPSPSLR